MARRHTSKALVPRLSAKSITLFIVIMPIGRQNIHMHFRLKDLVNNTMLFGDCSRPLTSPVATQRLWMTCTRIRMQCYFIKQLRGLLESSRLALLQLGKPFFGTRGISNDVHPSKSIKPSIHVFKVSEGRATALPAIPDCVPRVKAPECSSKDYSLQHLS